MFLYKYVYILFHKKRGMGIGMGICMGICMGIRMGIGACIRSLVLGRGLVGMGAVVTGLLGMNLAVFGPTDMDIICMGKDMGFGRSGLTPVGLGHKGDGCGWHG